MLPSASTGNKTRRCAVEVASLRPDSSQTESTQIRLRDSVLSGMALAPNRLGTETPFIQDLISDIRSGQIKIPQFQRKFVWKEEQAFRLLDSIKNKYPIGSLLIWRTGVKLAAERNIGDFQLPQTDDMMPTDYVLDGQQRITVIYASIGAPVTEGGFSPGYDLVAEEFVLIKDKSGPTVFPLRWLYETTDLLNFRTALLTQPNGHNLQANLESLIDAFTKYRIPVVTLKDLTIDEVCPIFERINSSGTKLSIYDLMVAATWSERFNLNHHVEAIAASLSGKSFERIERDTILKCLSAVEFGGIKKSEIISLRGLDEQPMQKLVDRVKQGLLAAVDVLATEFGIHSWDFLPYEAVLIITCKLCCEHLLDSSDAIERLRMWFWRSAFTERYRVGGENFVSNDIRQVAGFVAGVFGSPDDFGVVGAAEQWSRLQFRSNNATSRAFILALASKKPLSLMTGRVVDTAVALSSYNKKEFHHIYPTAHLKRAGVGGQSNCLANICMLPAAENNAISDSDPRTYLPDCIKKLGPNAEAVFTSNLLPSFVRFDYEHATFTEFVSHRSYDIADLVDRLCRGYSGSR